MTPFRLGFWILILPGLAAADEAVPPGSGAAQPEQQMRLPQPPAPIEVVPPPSDRWLPGELKLLGRPEQFDWFLAAPPEPLPLGRGYADAGRKRHLLVVLDPGHGGEQKGAVGVDGFTEKDFSLQMALEMAAELSRLPEVEVILTREQDEELSLWRRVEMANELGADVFISVHANALQRSEIGGVETFFHSPEATGEEARRVAGYENAASPTSAAGNDVLALILQDIQQAERLRSSAQLATLIHRKLGPALPWEDHGVMQADFLVLRGTLMPSVLLELGFVTNKRDVKLLRQAGARSKIAVGVAEGLKEFRELLLRKRGQSATTSEK